MFFLQLTLHRTLLLCSSVCFGLCWIKCVHIKVFTDILSDLYSFVFIRFTVSVWTQAKFLRSVCFPKHLGRDWSPICISGSTEKCVWCLWYFQFLRSSGLRKISGLLRGNAEAWKTECLRQGKPRWTLPT